MGVGGKSGEHPVSSTFILAMRDEIDKAIAPIKAGQDALAASVNARLAQGDTEIALLKQKQASQEQRCQAHQEPATERKQKKLHPWAAAAIVTVIQTITAAAAVWLLLGGLASGVQK